MSILVSAVCLAVGLTIAMRRRQKRNNAAYERAAEKQSFRTEMYSNMKVAEAANLAGIYVYALEQSVSDTRRAKQDRTLMRVGWGLACARQDFNAKEQVAAISGKQLLLRIYNCPSEEAEAAGKKFQRVLVSAGHELCLAGAIRPDWFITDTRFLDEVADEMQLRTIVVNDFSGETALFA